MQYQLCWFSPVYNGNPIGEYGEGQIPKRTSSLSACRAYKLITQQLVAGI